MRLLKLNRNGAFSFVEYFEESETPPYATLSHTWGPDSEEISLVDIQTGNWKHKAGGRKLLFTRCQTLKDGLEHCWIDTCCIDQKNSIDVSYAVNSMFRWYSNASRCYVFLSDVCVNEDPDEKFPEDSWKSAFKESRWFTRGWTLQELIAPESVHFFSNNGVLLGDKRSLSKEITKITRIPSPAFLGSPLSNYSERLSWTRRRRTKRPEDMVYCLFGLLDISMPLVYGEGYQKALSRLKREYAQQMRPLYFGVVKQLGYPWETETNHILLDDGLEAPFQVPYEFCSTRRSFINFIKYKFRSRDLPGAFQVMRDHVALFDWTGKNRISDSSWLLESRHGVKLAFIMGSITGFNKDKCIRCLKPYPRGRRGVFRTCTSCCLEYRYVAPDFVSYEPVDVALPTSDGWRDHKLQLCDTTPQSASIQSDTNLGGNKYNVFTPPIEFACRRMVIKWEPVFNVVHRYVLCRCVMRASTPSRITQELTFLLPDRCPRHNSDDISFLDYGNLNYHDDPYFAAYGGYANFQGIVLRTFPLLHEILGGDKFLPKSSMTRTMAALEEEMGESGDLIDDISLEYALECYEWARRVGNPYVPQDAIDIIEARDAENRWKDVKLHDDMLEMFRNSQMMQEVKQIRDGKYTGKPHWMAEVDT